jgi:TolB protein
MTRQTVVSGLRAASLAAGLCSLIAVAIAQNEPALPLSTKPPLQSDQPSMVVGMSSEFVLLATASQLDPADQNGTRDLYAVEIGTGVVTLVTRTDEGTPANGPTESGAIGEDESVVVQTSATNLARGFEDDNGEDDIYFLPPNGERWICLSVDRSGRPEGGINPQMCGGYITWTRGTELNIYNTESGRRQTVDLSRFYPGGDIDIVQNLACSNRGHALVSLKSRDVTGRFSCALLRVRVNEEGSVEADTIFYDSAIGLFDVKADMSADGGVVSFIPIYDYQDRVLVLYLKNMATGTEVEYRGVGTRGAASPVSCSLSPDGAYAAVCTPDGGSVSTVKLLDLRTGQLRIASVDSYGRERVLQEPTRVEVNDMGDVAFAATEGSALTNQPWVPGDNNGVPDVIVRRVSEDKTFGLTVGRGALGNDASGSAHTDLSGSTVVFSSAASNLVSGDNNGYPDIFIRSQDGSLRRIVAVDGSEPNGPSFDPKISSDGQWVVFLSRATNLTREGGNGKSQVYLYSVQSGDLWLVSRNLRGSYANDDSASPSVSNRGDVVFASAANDLADGDSNNHMDIFRYSHADGSLFRITTESGREPNGSSGDPVISSDGQWIAFSSEASNYVSGDTNRKSDVFVYHMESGRIVRVTINTRVQLDGESYQPSISGDGRYIAFASESTNVDPRDTDSLPDIYIWDRETGGITLASVNSFGLKADLGGRRPSISHDGNRVAFESDATNLMPLDKPNDTDIYVYDARTRWVYPISVRGCIPGEAPSFNPTISGDGGLVVFQTNATNLSDLPLGSNAYAVLQQVVCTPPGDVNRDGMIDDADLLQVLFDFGQETSCADVTMDDTVDDADLLVVLFNFGQDCASAEFVYGDDMLRDLQGLFSEAAVGGFVDEEGLHYRGTLMTPALIKSLERQAAEIDMMHQGRWPYPVAGRGSDPWIAAYGDPLAMSEEELNALLERFNNPPPQDDEGDFFPASGSSWSYSQTKGLQLGGSDVNASVNGSIYLQVSCTQAKMEAKGDANIKFFPLNRRVAEAYGFAEATNTQAKLHAYFKVAGSTLWSFGPQTWNLTVTRASQCHYGGGQPNIGPFTTSWAFTQIWWLGPIPVRVTAGINLEAGACYKLHAQLAPVQAEARFRPYVNSSAFASGGVGVAILCSAGAGVGIDLTLLNYALEAYVTGQIGTQNNRCCAQLTAGINNTITTLRGRFYIYAQACCWGLNGPGCGIWRRRQRWEWVLFNWGGYSASGHLWGPWSYTRCFDLD